MGVRVRWVREGREVEMGGRRKRSGWREVDIRREGRKRRGIRRGKKSGVRRVIGQEQHTIEQRRARPKMKGEVETEARHTKRKKTEQPKNKQHK